MKKAFTLAEVLIVVAILGILGALTTPLVKDYILSAKESAAKSNLHALRTAIKRYAIDHNDVAPGYADNKAGTNPVITHFFQQLLNGRYINAIPKNPFNQKYVIRMVADAGKFPLEATGGYGWIYKPATREIRLDWPGKDSKGVRYYDY